MAIQLPADVEARIREKVECGDFADAGEVVREAMRLLDAEERVQRGERPHAVDPFLPETRAEILRIANGNGATRVRVFGSFVHGTARPDSDLDLLIELEPGRSLLDLVAIKQDLEDLLGREVHVVTEAAVSPRIRDEVLRDARPL
jgi:predicted nucleotidyltransferase